MNPQDAIDFSREAIKTCMLVGGPILLASLLIGILIGIFQAMTQVQDQTVSFVPKILLLIVLIGLCLPWLTDQMLEFAKLSFEKPMTQWAGNSTSSAPRLFPTNHSESGQQADTRINVAVSASELVPAQPEEFQRKSATPTRLASAKPQPVERLNFDYSEDEKSNTEFSDQKQRPRNFEIPHFQTPPHNSQTGASPSPFLLPHYRTSPDPTSEIGG